MNRRLQACLVSLMMGAISGAVFAQSGVNVPLQRGVSVQLAVTSNAVAVPNADKQDALVVALTADGSVYLRADRLPTPALADRVRSILSTRNEKTLYVKADARVPYARLVEVIDAVQKSGVEGLTFLTAQRDAADQGGGPCRRKAWKCGFVKHTKAATPRLKNLVKLRRGWLRMRRSWASGKLFTIGQRDSPATSSLATPRFHVPWWKTAIAITSNSPLHRARPK